MSFDGVVGGILPHDVELLGLAASVLNNRDFYSGAVPLDEFRLRHDEDAIIIHELPTNTEADGYDPKATAAHDAEADAPANAPPSAPTFSSLAPPRRVGSVRDAGQQRTGGKRNKKGAAIYSIPPFARASECAERRRISQRRMREKRIRGIGRPGNNAANSVNQNGFSDHFPLSVEVTEA